MALPKKKTRGIEVDGAAYRWLVSCRRGMIHVSVQRSDGEGQLLQAELSPHRTYLPGQTGGWTRVGQGRTVTPKLVSHLIRHARKNGWQPETPGPRFRLSSWEADALADPPSIDGPGLPVRQIAIDQVSDLRFDLSLDPEWRRTLFGAEPLERFALPADYGAIGAASREHGLRYAVFNDGWTEDGFVVFGIESVDFPDVVMYTTNNPAYP